MSKTVRANASVLKRVAPNAYLFRVRMVAQNVEALSSTLRQAADVEPVFTDEVKFVDRNDGVMTMRIEFSATLARRATPPPKDSIPPPELVAVVGATFDLSYALDEETAISDDDALAFAQSNGLYNAWPYWREALYSSLSRIEVAPVVLPVLRVVVEPDRRSASADEHEDAADAEATQ